jgi:hypothetical protein
LRLDIFESTRIPLDGEKNRKPRHRLTLTRGACAA